MTSELPQPVEPASPRSDETLSALSSLVGLVVAPATAVTSLLYYFGWKRTQYFWQSFGFNERLLSYNTQDFLLRSVDALFYPAALVLLMALAIRSLHNPLTAYIVQSRWAGITERTLIVVGAALILVTLLGPWWRLVDESAVITPVGFASGVLLIAYSQSIHKLASPPAGSPSRGSGIVRLVLLALLLFIAAFWSVDNWARIVGRSRAEGIINQQLSGLPGATLYSRNRLQLGGGVTETVLKDGQDAYPFRYSGLRLLGYSNKKFFLLPKDWSRAADPGFVLTDDDAVRVDFTAPIEGRPG